MASLAMLLLLVPWMVPPHPCPFSEVVSSQSSSVLSTRLLITEFYPCGVCEDEYLSLRNCCGDTISLYNWSISDGEGSLRFICQRTLDVDEVVCISSNASSYAQAYGDPPSFSLNGWTSDENIAVTGSFRLADAGDSLVLVSPEAEVVDSVCYGESSIPDGWSGRPIPALRQGEVAKRLFNGSGPVDTDLLDDWTSFREYRYGYTEHSAAEVTVPAGSVVAFASPDCSLEVVLSSIDSSEESIRVCSYELYSVPFCEALAESVARGVDVTVLVDFDPAGGICQDEAACLSYLSLSGCDVLGIHGNIEDDIVRHVGPLHPKYMVIDGCRVLIMSENFVPDGIPMDPVHGNRGWGISVDSGALAQFMCEVFDDDADPSRRDVSSWRDHILFDHTIEDLPPLPDVHLSGTCAAYRSTLPCVVRLAVSPDASPVRPFLATLIEASHDTLFEQFQSDVLWDTRWADEDVVNPLLSAVLDSARAGGQSRGLFDSSWFNLERNQGSLSYLSASFLSAGLGGSFLLMDQSGPTALLHNKGMVLDDSVVISSNNWVYSSFARNRELAAIVESAELAEYFTRLFEMDWTADVTPPVANAGPDVYGEVGELVRLDASASSDDRGLTSVWWDFDGDGDADAFGEQVEFNAVAGYNLLTLHVEDAWGNHASDTVLVSVMGDDAVPESSASTQDARPPFWAIPLALVPVVLFARRLCVRKLNLGKRGS